MTVTAPAGPLAADAITTLNTHARTWRPSPTPRAVDVLDEVLVDAPTPDDIDVRPAAGTTFRMRDVDTGRFVALPIPPPIAGNSAGVPGGLRCDPPSGPVYAGGLTWTADDAGPHEASIGLALAIEAAAAAPYDEQDQADDEPVDDDTAEEQA